MQVASAAVVAGVGIPIVETSRAFAGFALGLVVVAGGSLQGALVLGGDDCTDPKYYAYPLSKSAEGVSGGFVVEIVGSIVVVVVVAPGKLVGSSAGFEPAAAGAAVVPGVVHFLEGTDWIVGFGDYGGWMVIGKIMESDR